MDYIKYILIFIFGLLFGNIFNYLGVKFSHKKGYKYSNCDNCNVPINFSFPLIKYLASHGKCRKCKKKISIVPVFIEFVTPILFLIIYLNFYEDPIFLNLAFAVLFTSALIIIYVSDIKYMLIPDKVLIIFGIILSILKLYTKYYNEEISSLLDLGYEIIFLLYDGFFMFLIMYVIKLLGDFLFKKDSMGGGDLKLMFFISMFLGWKLSIVVLFLGSFIALPESMINIQIKKNSMLAFGPYIVLSTLIIFLSRIDFNTIINYIK